MTDSTATASDFVGPNATDGVKSNENGSLRAAGGEVRSDDRYAGQIDGTEGNDTIEGTGGRDIIIGGDGRDDIDGGAGRDLIRAGAGNDKIDGGNNNDAIFGGGGNDLAKGGAGNDIISGQGGNDDLRGGEGDDVLDGGAGNDLLRGGLGEDTMIGGAGEDTFYFRIGADFRANEDDVVADFTSGEDILDLSGFGSLRFSGTQVGDDFVLDILRGNGDSMGTITFNDYMGVDFAGMTDDFVQDYFNAPVAEVIIPDQPLIIEEITPVDESLIVG